MDREKVAAGIAQKYKDILPFLRDSAQWKPNDEKDNYTPLYFGYGYLEKFIQISFSLPIAGNDATLDAFLNEKPTPPSLSPWNERLWSYWEPLFYKLKNTFRRDIPAEPEPEPEAKKGQQQKPKPKMRKYKRVAVGDDSNDIREIIKFVSPVFEYNPRRIKQFISTFRLALFIASDQGLFDEEEGGTPSISPEQVGKCIALLLRFPDMRFELEQNSRLLGSLEEMACAKELADMFSFHWLNKPGTVKVLRHGCISNENDEKSGTYGTHSLVNFDVSRLFSVLPRVIRPPEPVTPQASNEKPEFPDADFSVFLNLAARYEEIRKIESAGRERTRHMTQLAQEARGQAEKLAAPAQILAQLASNNSPGTRLMRILIASKHIDQANLEWLKDYNSSFTSPFEHYWCIATLLEYVEKEKMTDDDRAEINASLEARWKDIERDQGRVGSAARLRNLTRFPYSSDSTFTSGVGKA